MLSRFAGDYITVWVPACAGMTQSCVNGDWEMRLIDVVQFATGSLRGSPARTLLMMLAMSIGVAAVVVLTALGEGARRYVVDQFSSLGTNLVIVLPGRTETAGIGPGMMSGQTPRDITLVLVTHDAEIGARAQRCIHMLDGRIQSDEHKA